MEQAVHAMWAEELPEWVAWLTTTIMNQFLNFVFHLLLAVGATAITGLQDH